MLLSFNHFILLALLHKLYDMKFVEVDHYHTYNTFQTICVSYDNNSNEIMLKYSYWTSMMCMIWHHNLCPKTTLYILYKHSLNNENTSPKNKIARKKQMFKVIKLNDYNCDNVVSG